MGRKLSLFLGAVSIGLVLWAFVSTAQTVHFSPDSWAHFEASKELLHDFYKINTHRQYVYKTSYGISFPPLYSMFIFIVNSIVNIGVYAGWLINLLVALLILFVCVKIVAKLKMPCLMGIGIFSLIIINPWFMEEALAARSIPISVLFVLVLIYVILKKSQSELTPREIFLMALISGLGSLNRFDFLLPALLFALTFLFLQRNRLPKLFLFVCVFLITISPWIYYSLSHFHTIYISDNVRTALAAGKSSVLDYYFSDGVNGPAIYNQPFIWFFEKGNNLFQSFSSLFKLTILTTPAVFYFGLVFTQRIFKGRTLVEIFRFSGERNLIVKKLGIFSLFFILQIIIISLSGYPDYRYYVPALIYFDIFFTALIYYLHEKFFTQSIKLFVLLLFLSAVTMTFHRYPLTLPFGFNSQNITTDQYKNILDVMAGDGSDAKLFFDNCFSIFCPKFGALTKVQTFFPPTNINSCNIAQLVSDYQINYAYLNCDSIKNALSTHFYLQPTSVKNLFRVIALVPSKIDETCSPDADISLLQCRNSGRN